MIFFCSLRARAFGAAVAKIDKCCPNITRKRSRGDSSSNERSTASLCGGAMSRIGPHGHLMQMMQNLGLKEKRGQRMRYKIGDCVHP